VFSEVGYSRASTKQIAERAGVAEPLLFRNFGSKAALFAEVVLGPFDDFIEDWKQSHPGTDPHHTEREIAVDLIGRTYDLFIRNRGLILTYIATSVFEPEVVRIETAPMFLHAIDMLAEWADTQFVKPRGLTPMSVRIANRAVIGMVMSMALYQDWLLSGSSEPPSRETIVNELADIVLYGILRPRPRTKSQ
jgi:AcrR family transcriptional regulator